MFVFSRSIPQVDKAPSPGDKASRSAAPQRRDAILASLRNLGVVDADGGLIRPDKAKPFEEFATAQANRDPMKP